ncbi:MAG: DUF433 domain-containing protein [Candidatus Zixiibacteriota bacterium]|nr:MAG: DUF433 domain-containing protein [candidate division Zixibacteria bacterium]
MESWLRIRNTGVNILEILELVSKGCSCPEIQERYPNLSHRDLARAAAVVLDHVVSHISVDILFGATVNPSSARPVCLHDDTPWTDDEDEELRRLVRYRFDQRAIARLLRRSERAVTARLEQIRSSNP